MAHIFLPIIPSFFFFKDIEILLKENFFFLPLVICLLASEKNKTERENAKALEICDHLLTHLIHPGF